MNSLALLPVFLIGLFGGVHCVGMCGGIVSAFSVATPARRPFPIAVVAADRGRGVFADGLLRVLAFNAGRIGSYMLAGAFVAGLAGSVRMLTQIAALQTAGYWAANLMLILLGFSLMNFWHGLSYVEMVGQFLWRRIQPLMRPLLPIEHTWQALALGALWGWVPCAMVYSVLMTALLTGSVLQGALVMLAFGLGTLPLLFTMGLLGRSVQPFLRQPRVRFIAGSVVVLFGLLGLVRVATGLSYGFLDTLCISPVVH